MSTTLWLDSHLFVHALQVLSDVIAPLWDVRAVDICQGGMVFGSSFGLIHQLLPDLHGGKQLPAISPAKSIILCLQKRNISDLTRPLKYQIDSERGEEQSTP